MKISVIIPAYNMLDYLAEAIESILAQSYKDYEIILVDDGSQQDIASLVRDYPLLYIRQENQGVSAARNTGIKAASGDFLHFLDADDKIINPDFFAKAMALFQQNPQLGCIHSGWINIDKAGKNLATIQPYQQFPQLDAETWFIHCPMRLNAMLFRRTNAEFRPELAYTEDVDYTIRLLIEGMTFTWLPEVTVAYRHHQSSKTGILKTGNTKVSLGVWHDLFAHPRFPKSLVPKRKLFYYYKILWSMRRLFNANDLAALPELIAEALKKSPYTERKRLFDLASEFHDYEQILPCLMASNPPSSVYGLETENILRWWLKTGWIYHRLIMGKIPLEAFPKEEAEAQYLPLLILLMPALFFNEPSVIAECLNRLPANQSLCYALACWRALKDRQWKQAVSFAAKLRPKALWQALPFIRYDVAAWLTK